MASLKNITTAQISQVLELREQIESLQARLDAIRGGTSANPTKRKGGRSKGKRTMSAKTIEKMRAAQQAGWAKNKGRIIGADK